MKILIKPVDYDQSLEGLPREFPINDVTSFALNATKSDDSIDMDIGNKTISVANNAWAINGINGTLKENMSAGDLNVTGLPDGLILLAAKGPDNKIIITLTGTAVSTVSAITNVNIVVKGSAVVEDGAMKLQQLVL